MTAGADEDSQRRNILETSDPSRLTTAQILREVGALKELVFTEIASIKDAVKVAHEDLVRLPTATQQAVAALHELIDARLATHLEKFDGIERQFKERDTRIEQTAKDDKTAIDAALLAAEKAVGKQQEASDKAITKSELSFTKQFETQGQLIGTSNAALEGKINDLKDRLTRIESLAIGRVEQKTETRNDTSLWVAIGSLAVGIVLGAMGYLIAK